MSQPVLGTPAGNSLLDALPEDERHKLERSLNLVSLTRGQLLSTQGEAVEHVYFPTTALISCRASGSEGELIEIYAVGHEGVAEAAAILTGVAAVTSEVQIPGDAYQIRIDELCTLLGETRELPAVLLKYAYSLAVRMVQSTKCAMF